MIAIHRGSQILLEVGVNQGSIRRFNLMKEDFIRLKFSLTTNTPLLIGDYVDLTDYINSCDNENFRIKNSIADQTTKKFVLDRNYYPTFNKDTGGWDYDVQINAYYHQWKNKMFMFNPSKGAAESSFSLTDTIDKHVELVVKNLASAELKWDADTEYSASVQKEAQTKGMKPITYSAVSIYGALDMIAQAFECEWWLDGGSKIYFGYRKGDETTTLTLNEEIADTSISDSDGVHATRIYAFGGTTNVPKHYRDKLEFKVNSYWFEDGAIKGVKDSTKPVLSSYFRGGKSKADERLLTISKSTSSKGGFTSEEQTPDIAAVTSTSVVSIEGQTYDIDLSNLKINFKATHLVGSEGESTGLIEVGKDINIRASVVATDGTNEDVIASEVKNIKIDRGTPTTSVSFTNSQRKFSFVPSSIEIRVEVISAKWTYTKHMGDESRVDGKWYDYKRVEFEFSNEQAVISFQKSAQSAETIIHINGGTKDYTAIINPNYKDGGSNILITDYTGAWEDIKTYTFPNIVISRVPSQYFSQEDGGVQNGVVQKNLMLPIGINYVQADGVTDANVVEAIMVYDWIYPKTALKVTAVDPFHELKVEIEDGQTVDTTTYDITLPIEDYEDDLWVDPSQMFAIFQSGKAAGLRFELRLVSEKLTSTSVTFRLVPNEDYSITVPNEATIPAIGDEVILDGIDISFLSGNAISEAEEQLLDQANKDIVETSKEDKVVDITLSSDYAYNKGRIALGTLTSLVDVLSSEDNAYDSRILGFEECLDIPWDKPKYIIGDKNYYNRQASIESKLENIEKGSITLSGVNIGGGGSNIPIIKVKDSTKPTDANVYSALRSREEFAKRKEEETFSEKVTFNKDIDVKGTTTTNALNANTAKVGQMAVSGDATIDGTTKLGNDLTIGDYFEQGDIIKGARVTKAGVASFAAIKSPTMQIYELIYNRKTAVQGDFVFSDGDTIDKVEYIKDGNVADSSDYDYIRLTMREQYQGYMSSFKADDILYSNVNLIGASGEAATTGKCWMYVLQEENAFGVTPVDGLVVNVAWYGLSAVPNGVNMLPTEHMVVTRHGNRTVTSRQHVFLISSETGALIQLMGVDSPIIKTEGSYGAVLGLLPDTLKEYVRSQGATYINDNQPYLYARGVIVQDLIRLDYQGKPILQANYRGYWSAEEAEENPYMVTDSTFDTVTHKGALWVCQTSYTKLEPADNVGDWLKQIYVEENSYRFSLIPSANSIHYYTSTDKFSVSKVDVKVGVQTYAKYFDIEEQSVLNSYNLGVYYAIDGVGERVKLNISPVGVFVMEDGSTIISTEGGSGLSLDGDDIDVSAIQDNITLYLIYELTKEEKDKFVIQVTKDGQKGDKGADGAGYSLYISTPIISHPIDAETKKTIGSQEWNIDVQLLNNGEPMATEGRVLVYGVEGSGIEVITAPKNANTFNVYVRIPADLSSDGRAIRVLLYIAGADLPSTIVGNIAIAYLERGMAGRDGALPYACGTWDVNVSYKAATDITPFVLHKGEYYVRTSQPYELTIHNEEIHNEPDVDVAQQLGCWRRMDKYEAIYTKMLFADYARLAQAVFFGDYMFSERGVNNRGESGIYDAYVDDLSGNVPMFTDKRKLSGSLTPNLFIDFVTGEMKANKLSSPFSLFNVTSDNIGKTINLEDSFNVTIAMHPDNYGNAQPSILAMPNPTKITALDGTILEDMPWSADGAYSTIIYQSDDTFMSIKGENDDEYPSYISILCADGRILDRRSYRPFNGQIEYAPTGYSTSKPLDNEGYFVVNGCYTKFLLLLPSDIVKLRQSNELMSNGTTRTLWYVENQTDFNRVKFKLSVCPDKVYNEDGTLEENRKYYTFDHTSDSGWYYDSKSAWCSAYLFDKVAGQEVTMEADISVKTQEDKEINIVDYLG